MTMQHPAMDVKGTLIGGDSTGRINMDDGMIMSEAFLGPYGGQKLCVMNVLFLWT